MIFAQIFLLVFGVRSDPKTNRGEWNDPKTTFLHFRYDTENEKKRTFFHWPWPGERVRPYSLSVRLSTVADTNKNSQDNKSVRNITKMVIVSVFFKIFLEMPYSVCVILNLFGVDNILFLHIINFAYGLLFLSPSLNLFVYYFFNKNFSNILNDYFKLKFN